MTHSTWRIIEGDARTTLASLPEASIRCCVTSPPYYGLRDYGHDGQIGLEASPEEYVAELVAVFREVRRALTADGTLWVNLGDSYAGSGGAQSRGATSALADRSVSAQQIIAHPKRTRTGSIPAASNYKAKDLLGIPWMVAFALRADGWYLRAEHIWDKPAPMPESVRDRCTRSHEQLFLFAKRPRYFYDARAIAEPSVSDHDSGNGFARDERETYRNADGTARGQAEAWTRDENPTRNKRTVWRVGPEPCPEAHFAVMPGKLAEPCVLAGSEPGDMILDPFAGAGTTGIVALRHGRSFVGVELNPEFVSLARRRIVDDAPLLNQVAEAA